MYFEWPLRVAIRPSSDWPSWATTTRSSTAPLRNGPNRSSHGDGSLPQEVRKPCGTVLQQSVSDKQLFILSPLDPPGFRYRNNARASSKMSEYGLHELPRFVPATMHCHETAAPRTWG